VTDAITTPGNGDGDFVAVTDISGVPTGGVIGVELDLSGAAVVPDNATNKTIVWTVTDAGGTGIAGFTEGKATPAAAGTLTLSATVANGKTASTPFTKEFTIPVVDPADFVAVTGITGVPATGTAGTELDLSGAVVVPDNATNKTIVWSVAAGSAVSADSVTISGATVTSTAAGTLTLTATIANGKTNGTESYTQDFTVTVSAGGGINLSGVTLSSVTADGSDDTFEPTTKVTLTFSGDVAGLAAEHIAFEASGANADFVNGVAKGELKRTGEGVYELPVDALLSVGPQGAAEFTVTVFDGEIELSPSNPVTLYAWVEVADAEALAAIGEDADTLSYWYKQTENITISGTWTPIGGTSNTPFTGVYNGANKEIYPDNVEVSGPAGIFLYTNEAELKNIHIGAGSMVSVAAIGGIVFNASNTTFTNCSNAATLTAAFGAGGICTVLNGGTTIDSCWNTGDITASSAGGICGSLLMDDANVNTVINCYNSGNISGGSTEASTLGGITSVMGCSNVIACYNTGTVTGTGTTMNDIGGIAGSSGGVNNGSTNITACYNAGNVSISSDRQNDSEFHLGGIVGKTMTGYANITACYNAGNVSYTGSGTGGIVHVGGVIGYSAETPENEGAITKAAEITACYWKAEGNPANGIGGKRDETHTSFYDPIPPPDNTGTVKFSSSAWPATGSGEGQSNEWGTGDGSGSGQYWKLLGGWNGGSPVYPKLWFED
jgi:hypothetical protein